MPNNPFGDLFDDNADDLINEVLEQSKAVLRKVAEDDELFELSAIITRKAYEALVKVGFTEEQAGILATSIANGLSKK